MTHYQLDSLFLSISHHTYLLSLPLSDRACVISADSRDFLRRSVLADIEYIYDRSLIDSLRKDELLISLSDAYAFGGV